MRNNGCSLWLILAAFALTGPNYPLSQITPSYLRYHFTLCTVCTPYSCFSCSVLDIQLTHILSMASTKLFNVLKNGLVEIELNSDATVLTKSKVRKPENIRVWRNVTSQTVPGTVILDTPMSKEWNNFEFKILKVGDFGEIGIGLGPSDYNVSVMPGWYPKSIGYHADDGKLYHSSGNGLEFGPMCRHGDTMGCGVDFGGEKQGYVTVWFTKNGDLAGPPQRLLRSS